MMEKIKVLFDHQTFHNQVFGGISRYFFEMVTRFDNVQPRIALAITANRYIKSYKGSRHLFLPKKVFKILEGLIRTFNKRRSLRMISKGDYNVFHPTYYDTYFLEALKGRPFVLTIHDMTHEKYPQYFSASDPTRNNKKILAEKAARIIAISESTKRDIIDMLGVAEDKIDVIYHGIDQQPLAQGKPDNLPDEYILYVGERRGYKNFNNTVEAFVEIRKSHPEMHLVLAGRQLSNKETEQFRSLGISRHVVCYSHIADSVLRQLYRNARLFVYPSLYEGFGIPILEAFAQDCPVVLSNASCFPEVAGDAGEYFEADSVESQTKALLKVIENDDLREKMVSRGRKRQAMFSWQETARRTEETYRKVLSHS